MRKLRRNRNKKHVRVILAVAICFLTVMTVGYAAFSTNISLNAKGNVVRQNGVRMLKAKALDPSSTNDGIYNVGDGLYVFRGANPANYISFNNETWRIMSVDSQGIKIIKDEAINLTGYTGVDSEDNTKGAFDIINARPTANNSYCAQSATYGCNVWAATANLVGQPSEFVSGSLSGTVTQDATLNTFLNGTYYTNTLNSNSNIIRGTFNVGPVEYNNNDISAAKTSESAYQWQGYIALATPSEYLAANTNQTQCGTESLNNTNVEICQMTNYLFKSTYSWWFINGHLDSNSGVRDIWGSSGTLNSSRANYTGKYAVFPVLYLSPSIYLSGNGTNDSNIYRIVP